MNAFSTSPSHRTHNRFSSCTPARYAVHGSKLPLESTTAHISPAAVSFASSENIRLVFPEPARPVISANEPRINDKPNCSSRTSSVCRCSSLKRDTGFTKLKCRIAIFPIVPELRENCTDETPFLAECLHLGLFH